jgi:hypothetical protein
LTHKTREKQSAYKANELGRLVYREGQFAVWIDYLGIIRPSDNTRWNFFRWVGGCSELQWHEEGNELSVCSYDAHNVKKIHTQNSFDPKVLYSDEKSGTI